MSVTAWLLCASPGRAEAGLEALPPRACRGKRWAQLPKQSPGNAGMEGGGLDPHQPLDQLLSRSNHPRTDKPGGRGGGASAKVCARAALCCRIAQNSLWIFAASFNKQTRERRVAFCPRPDPEERCYFSLALGRLASITAERDWCSWKRSSLCFLCFYH